MTPVKNMREAVIFRHVAFEDLGSLEDLLSHSGFRIRYLDAGRDSPDPATLQKAGLVGILGGPISANDEQDYPFLAELRQALSRRIESGLPTFGICLGAQIIARALGAAVRPAEKKELGWSELELTAAGRNSCLRHFDGVPVLHWHGETFEMPEGTEHLAATANCRNQAFRIGNHVLAVQFHPEVTKEGLESWYIGLTRELARSGIKVAEMRSQGKQFGPGLQHATVAAFGEWLDNLQSTTIT